MFLTQYVDQRSYGNEKANALRYLNLSKWLIQSEVFCLPRRLIQYQNVNRLMHDVVIYGH
jgi:hypothetical protein